jgi:hypothetical protein
MTVLNLKIKKRIDDSGKKYYEILKETLLGLIWVSYDHIKHKNKSSVKAVLHTLDENDVLYLSTWEID